MAWNLKEEATKLERQLENACSKQKLSAGDLIGDDLHNSQITFVIRLQSAIFSADFSRLSNKTRLKQPVFTNQTVTLDVTVTVVTDSLNSVMPESITQQLSITTEKPVNLAIRNRVLTLEWPAFPAL